MKVRTASCTAVVCVGLLLIIPAVGVAQPLAANADNGLSERLFGANGKIGKDEIGFVWVPTLNSS